MGDVVDMPGGIEMQTFTEVDADTWTKTELILQDPLKRRRLVRTQVEGLLALYRDYPLSEFASIGQILIQMQQAYSDVEPFNPHDDDEE